MIFSPGAVGAARRYKRHYKRGRNPYRFENGRPWSFRPFGQLGLPDFNFGPFFWRRAHWPVSPLCALALAIRATSAFVFAG